MRIAARNIGGRRLVAVLVTALIFGAACSKRSVPVEKKSVPEEKLKGSVRTNLDNPNPTPTQLARKQKSIAAVKQMGLPWIEHLPVVEDETRTKPRTTKEVVSRCLATEFCAVRGESNDKKLADGLIEKFGIAKALSPQERAFIQTPSPSKQQLADFAWRYECVHVFLWALGYLPALNPPNQIADVAKEVSVIRDKGPENFGKDAKLRPLSELLDQADLYYRLHWAAVELRLKGQKHEKINEEIIMERHRALNWLIRYMGQEWDDVTTDT